MNTRLNTTLKLGLLAAVVAPTLALAMGPGAGEQCSMMGPHGTGGMRHTMHPGMGPDAALPMMHGLQRLDLSEAQHDKLFALRQSQAQAHHDQMKAVRRAKDELQTLAKAEKYDAAKARAAADTLGKATAELALMMTQMGSQLNGILTPEQRQKLEAMKAMHDGNGPHGPGAGMGPKGPRAGQAAKG